MPACSPSPRRRSWPWQYSSRRPPSRAPGMQSVVLVGIVFPSRFFNLDCEPDEVDVWVWGLDWAVELELVALHDLLVAEKPPERKINLILIFLTKNISFKIKLSNTLIIRSGISHVSLIMDSLRALIKGAIWSGHACIKQVQKYYFPHK